MRHGVIGGKWKVIRRLGKGGFAEVYEVEDLQQPGYNYALKIADTSVSNTTTALKAEYKAVQKLHELGCRRLVGLQPDSYGEHASAGFFVMDLAGCNMADLQPVPPQPRWDTPVLVRAGLQILAAIEGIHVLGVLHRDIKPANCVIFPARASLAQGDWRLLDFGTCRRFRAADGSILPARQNYHEFRGSTSYASVNAHQLHDLGRVDDLWSWFYLLAELWEGRLPWRRDHATKESPPDKEAILEQKLRCQQDPAELTPSCALPGGLRSISDYLLGLEFASEPDYDLLRSHVASLAAISSQPQAPEYAAAGSGGEQLHAQQQTSPAAPLTGRQNGLGGNKRGREEEPLQEAAKHLRTGEPQQASAQADHDWHAVNGHAQAAAVACQEQVEAFAETVAQGDLSDEAWKACSQLASLDAAEGLGVMAWVLQRMAACVPPGSAHVIAPWIVGFGSFARQCSRQCWHGKGA